MFLEIYLQRTSFPWNLTDSNQFKKELFHEEFDDFNVLVDELENILIINSILNSEFQVEFIPTSILEYPNFLWHNLSKKMPTYKDINETKIIETLQRHDILEPNKKQIIWTLDNWLKIILDSKLGIWVNYFYKYFGSNQNEQVKHKILSIVENHRFNNQIAKNYTLLYFIMNIAPLETKILMNKLKKDSSQISNIAQEILDELS